MQGKGRSIHGGVLGANKLLKTLTRALINAQREDYFLQKHFWMLHLWKCSSESSWECFLGNSATSSTTILSQFTGLGQQYHVFPCLCICRKHLVFLQIHKLGKQIRLKVVDQLRITTSPHYYITLCILDSINPPINLLYLEDAPGIGCSSYLADTFPPITENPPAP